jgi:hypothetical protein
MLVPLIVRAMGRNPGRTPFVRALDRQSLVAWSFRVLGSGIVRRPGRRLAPSGGLVAHCRTWPVARACLSLDALA